MAKFNKSDFRPAGEWIDALPDDRRERIEANARRMAAEMHLAEIRKALSLTQTEISKRTGMAQSDISRFEKAELEAAKIGTLERYVNGMGGNLRIVAEFPDGTEASIPMRHGRPVKSKVKAA